MIIRDSDRKLFINADGIHGVRIYDCDLIIDFGGFRIELREEERDALYEALKHLDRKPEDSLVFEDVGTPHFPEYKMMRWHYDSERNHGGPVEIQSSTSTAKVRT